MSWPLVKLKDCCEVVGGATPKRDVQAYWDSADVPWVTPKDVSNLESPVLPDAPEYISEAGFKSCSTSMLPKGSVLVTSRAPIGNIAIAGRDLCTNQGFKSLIPGPSVDSIYLYYCMKHSSKRLQALGNGATFKEVSKKIVEEFEVPLPPLPEQKRIAAILDKADAIRRKRQQAIQLADDFLRAVFLDMFGDPITNPKGWEVRPLLENITHANNGLSRRRKEPDNVGEIVLRLQDVHYDGIRLEKDLNRIRLEDSEKQRFLVKKGDILFIRVNGNPDYVGRSAVFEGFNEDVYHNDHLIRIKVGEAYHPVFLSYCFNHEAGRRIISGQVKTSAGQHTISQSGIGALEFYMPPLALQERFVRIRNEVFNLPLSSDMPSGLFSSLSQRAFSGQL